MFVTTTTEVLKQLADLAGSWQQFLNQNIDWFAGPAANATTGETGKRPLTDSAGNLKLVATPAEIERFLKDQTDRLQAVMDAISAGETNATRAETAATSAESSKTAAASSASSALSSKNSATSSASSALSSKNAAATSATNAAASAAQAKTSETNAGASATAAASSEAKAISEANKAAASASAASTSASTASSKATLAGTSASSADQSSSVASDHASTATTKATQASTSATQAANSKTAAEAAASQSVSAKTAAEAARDQAVAAAATVTGTIQDMGPWNASTGVYPAKPGAGSGFWKVTGSGTVSGVDFGVGDTLVYSTRIDDYYKIDNTESVTSVNGFKGAVNLTHEHVGASHSGHNHDIFSLNGLDGKFGGRPIPLSTQDLNTLNNAAACGYYRQSASANALVAERNYPMNAAGTLEVRLAYDGSGVIQTYRQYNNGTTATRSLSGGSWSAWSFIFSQSYKPSAADVGLGNVPNTVHTATEQASTAVLRDSNADIRARLFRASYKNDSYFNGALAFRVNDSSDNFLRFTTNNVAVRTWLDAAPTSHTHPYLPLTGGTLTGVLMVSSNTYAKGSVTELTSAPINYGAHSVGAEDKFLPMGHLSASHSQGYRTHLSIGLFKAGLAGSGWGNGKTGMYVALGGNDNYPTEHFTLCTGGHIKHSAGHTFYHTSNKPSPADLGAPTITGAGATGTWGISITGSAPTLTTARTINGTSFNGSANIVTSYWGTTRSFTVGASTKTVNGSANMAWSITEILGAQAQTPSQAVYLGGGADLNTYQTPGIYYQTANANAASGTNYPSASAGSLIVTLAAGVVQKYHLYASGETYIRGFYNGSWSAWKLVLNSANFNSYAPTKTGTGASGTWAISVTGNAGSATVLQTARTINGTSFNGGANIVTAYWGTARTLTIGNTGKSVNGSANVAWSLSEIGAAPASHSHTPAQVGLSNVPNTVHTTSASASTVVLRDSAADIHGRLFRSNYQNESRLTGAIAFRVNTSDNYIRFCSDPAAARGWLGAAPSSHSHAWGDITGAPATATRWPSWGEVSGKPAVLVDGGTHGTLYLSNWFRSNGGTGWYNQTYGGGIYMIDSTWVRVYNNKSFYCAAVIKAETDVIMVSDERLKTNIQVIKNALDKVRKIRGVVYDRIDKKGVRQVGVLAGEVQKVLPEVVHVENDKFKTKAVAYGNMVGLLVEAVKEVDTLLAGITARLSALESRHV